MKNPWAGERCELCDGPIAARKVDVPRQRGWKLVLVRGVPAGVCRRCGARYFEGRVAKHMDSLLRASAVSPTTIAVPVVRYTGS